MLASEAYLPWNPSEVWHDNFIPHPTHVCEPINLATAAQPPIKNNRLSEETKGLSTLQYETICRILDSFEVRGAFLLGDATGVGKGRTIAGLIAELFRRDPCGRIMWVSANIRLRDDAAKELAAVGMEMDERVVFTSYSSLQNSQRTDSASKFLVEAEHPVVILDECHALRNTRAKCHQTAMGFLNRLRAQRPIRILYSSATACSTPARTCAAPSVRSRATAASHDARPRRPPSEGASLMRTETTGGRADAPATAAAASLPDADGPG